MSVDIGSFGLRLLLQLIALHVGLVIVLTHLELLGGCSCRFLESPQSCAIHHIPGARGNPASLPKTVQLIAITWDS